MTLDILREGDQVAPYDADVRRGRRFDAQSVWSSEIE
jgi:hypothetical protein